MAGARKKLETAFALHRTGDAAGAERGYREVLRKSPRDPDALHLLGVLLHQQGRHEEALPALRRAARTPGAGAPVWNNLGEALRATGAFEEAAEAYRRALAAEPRMVSALSNLGLVLLESGAEEEAEAVLRRAVALDPGYAPAHYNLGTLLHRTGRAADAEAAYRRALSLAPGAAPPKVNLALVLADLDRPEEAERELRAVLRSQPDHPEALVNLASLLRDQGRLDEGLDAARACLATHPGHPDATVEAASILDLQGAPSEAAALLEPMLAAGAAGSNAIAAYAAAARQLDRREAAIDRVRAAIDARPFPDTERSLVLFELARLLDEAERRDEAFAVVAEANRLHPGGFDIGAHRHETDRIVAAFPAPAATPADQPSMLPVFVVGMPRSGTTLVEQILAAHRSVHGAGEREDLNRLVAALPAESGEPFPDGVAGLGRDTLNRLSAEHVARLAALAPDAERVVDKMPGNFRHLGLIRLLFPAARIIHCRRDPLDTCLSCFFQRFSGSHPYAYDLRDLGLYYRDYLRLMAHWRETLDPPMLEVDYERLVAEPEAVSRAMIDHLGLAWDPAVLEPHASGRVVLTASYDQVRKPVNDRSVGRWRHYAAHLGPLRDALGPCITEKASL